MKCPECQDLLPAYALDALTGDEREQVRAHLRSGCATCAAELAQVRAVLTKLPLALDPVAPPGDAKRRLMERVDEQSQVRSRPPENPAAAPRRARRWAEPLLAAAAAAAAVAAVLWIRIDHQQGQIADLRTELARQQARIDQVQAGVEQEGGTIRLFASPAVQLVALQGSADQPAAKGRVFWDQDRNAFHLYASGLKPLPAEKTYELWFINAEQKKIPAGTFQTNARGEASLVATAPADAGRIAAMAVTDEPAAGSPQPTGHIQLIGQPG